MLRIKELRNEKNISLRELATQVNISYSSLGKYERGEQQPNIDTLIILSKFFQVSTDYLLGNSNFKNMEDEYKFKSTFDEVENGAAIDLYNAFVDCLTQFSNYYKHNCIPEHHPSLSFIIIDHIANLLSGYNTIAEHLINGYTLENIVLDIVGNGMEYNPTKQLIEEILFLQHHAKLPTTK